MSLSALSTRLLHKEVQLLIAIINGNTLIEMLSFLLNERYQETRFLKDSVLIFCISFLDKQYRLR
jgi:hypothetical protein